MNADPGTILGPKVHLLEDSLTLDTDGRETYTRTLRLEVRVQAGASGRRMTAPLHFAMRAPQDARKR
jgi:hypothetical protein